MGFGDSWLRFNGIGENVAWGVYNNDNPTEAARGQFTEICRWAAAQGLSLNIHWHNDKSVGLVLDTFERVNREHPIGALRWTIVHLEDASDVTLKRMKPLGVGWALQDAGYFEGEAQLKEKGAAAMKRIPRMNSALYIGVHVGAGTDAHRVMSYNPWVALRWMLDGKTVGGVVTRGSEETPTRENALRMYTLGSAWFAFAERERGSLEAGKLADLVMWKIDGLGHSTIADPVTAIVFGAAAPVTLSLINGEPVVEDNHLITVDEEAIARTARDEAQRLARVAAQPR
jgi:predicted amidohydrolase YtcJ